MGAAYLDSLDIANRALQHCGVSAQYRINSVDEDSQANRETSEVYDKVRRAELQRNIWTFATRKVILRPLDRGVYLLDPALWDNDAIYFTGAIVKDENGGYWFSSVMNNVGNEPGSTTAWEPYFGPLSVHPYDSTITYSAGELVYSPIERVGSISTATAFAVFMSLISANDSDPEVPVDYDADTIYNKGQCVLSGGDIYYSLIDYNQNNFPTDAPQAFDPGAEYSTGNLTTASDGFVYSSIGDNNQGNDPTSNPGSWTFTGDAAAWSRSPVQYPANINWMPIYAGMSTKPFVYPLGTGPSTQSEVRRAYKLPAGYLRRAPLDPKAGSVSWLGAPHGLMYDDFLFENGYIITGRTGPMIFRFVADVTDVTGFDDMFCEGLACRIAREVCETLTQSATKLRDIGAAYQKFMSEARLVDAIEAGATEPPEDDYILCRI